MTGQQWYQLEASRAVNQAIGRIIRHKNDYGAIILCDCRFENAAFKQQLSTWLRPYIKKFENFGIVTRTLREFFKNAQENVKEQNVKTLNIELIFICFSYLNQYQIKIQWKETY